MRCTAKDGCQHHSTAVVTCISFYSIHNGEAVKPSSPSNVQTSINNAVNNWSSLDGFQQDKGFSLPLLKISWELENKEAEVKGCCLLPPTMGTHLQVPACSWLSPSVDFSTAPGDCSSTGRWSRGLREKQLTWVVVPIFQGKWQIQFHRHVQIRVQNPRHNTRTSVFTKVIIIV